MDDDFDDQPDERATRTTRRSSGTTEHLPAETGSSYGDPVRQNWRSDRTAGRPRRNQALPSSRQELVVWLQHGGWRIVAIVSAVVILLLFLIVFLRSRPSANQAAAIPTTNPFAASISPQPIATLPPEPTPAPQTINAQFRVTGTDTDGLFLRPDHSTDGAAIKTLPEGSVVTVIGEDYSGTDHVWKHIRDTDGTEGWVVVDFLKPAQ